MTQGQEMDPTLAELIGESRAAAAQAITELAELRQEVTSMAAAERAAREAAEARREERARAGELGPEQRRLQQRIDLGETSWGAVLSGADTSPEADAVWTSLTINMDAFTDQVEAGLATERAAERPDPRAELIVTLAGIRATVSDMLAQQNEGNPRGQ